MCFFVFKKGEKMQTTYTCKKCGASLAVDHPDGFFLVRIDCKNPGHDVTIASGRTEQPPPPDKHLWDLIRENNLAAIAGALHNQQGAVDEPQAAVDALLDRLGIEKESDNG
jgi:hypothetical protein